MQTVLLTLISSTRQIDLKLPAEVPVGDLLPKLLDICEPQQAHSDPSQWRLILPGKGVALPPQSSLSDCGVDDGASLLLQNRATYMAWQRQNQGPSFRPRSLEPSADTGGIGVKWHFPNG